MIEKQQIPPVEIIRSPNRTRTASAKLVDGKVIVRVPASCTPEEERKLVDTLVGRMLKAQRRSNFHKLPDLRRRANDLNRTYFGGKLKVHEIKWVANQESRHGSCTPSTRTIRISDRIASMPVWVLDYVIMHELSHLLEANHSPAFWKLVARYPLTERARGYLIAKDLEGEQGPENDVTDE